MKGSLPRLILTIVVLLQVQAILHADTLPSLPVHPREGTRPEAMLFLGQVRNGARTHAVMPDGTLEEWRGGVFGAGYSHELSADRQVLLVNAVRHEGGQPDDGPCSVFTRDSWWGYPGRDYSGGQPPVGGRLTSDGRRVWLVDRVQGAALVYDTTSGVQTATLPLPRSQQGNPSLPGFAGPQFRSCWTSGGAPNARAWRQHWAVADEANERWMRLCVQPEPSTGHRDDFTFRYPDGRESHGILNLWRGPDGGVLMVEKMEWRTTEWAVRVHRIRPGRMEEWLEGAVASGSHQSVASKWPIDPTLDLDFREYGPTSPGGITMRPNRPLAAARLHARFSADGAWAIVDAGATGISSAALLLVGPRGDATVLPSGYSYADFTQDGKALLAVISRQIIDATADPKQQVLAKIGLGDGNVTWTSEPFMNCRGMVPYPAFDLEEFRGTSQ